MSAESNAVPGPELDSATVAPALLPTRPFFWSVRRELWENRSLHVAPLVAAAIALFGLSIRAMVTVERMRGLPGLEPERQRVLLATPYGFAAIIVMFTTVLVGAYYCLDALYGERRDRSILFWKSLPVSDRTTVLAKASIPLVVLPAQAFLIVLVTQTLLLLVTTAVLAVSGISPSVLWAKLPLVQMTPVMLYGLTVHALWHAPLYAWLLLVSGWARRAVFLWVVLPPLAIVALERMAFGTRYFGSLIAYRLGGAMREAFDVGTPQKHAPVIDRLSQLDPVGFVTSPGLWMGLAFAAVFLAAAVRLRRYREPI